jgi:hypothetical protein
MAGAAPWLVMAAAGLGRPEVPGLLVKGQRDWVVAPVGL